MICIGLNDLQPACGVGEDGRWGWWRGWRRSVKAGRWTGRTGAAVVVKDFARAIGAKSGAAAVASDVAGHLPQRSPRGSRALRTSGAFYDLCCSPASPIPAHAAKRALRGRTGSRAPLAARSARHATTTARRARGSAERAIRPADVQAGAARWAVGASSGRCARRRRVPDHRVRRDARRGSWGVDISLIY